MMTSSEAHQAKAMLTPHCVARGCSVVSDYGIVGFYVVALVKPYGSHRVFSSLGEARSFVADCNANDLIDCDYRSGVARTF